jgi:hypothetical protein
MQLMNRIRKLEGRKPESDGFPKFGFVSFVTPGTMANRLGCATIVGHSGRVFRDEDEGEGEFLQRVLQVYVDWKDLEMKSELHLKDIDRKILVASRSPEAALKHHNQ